MKRFTDLKPGDCIYYLIDRYGVLQKCGNGSVGFANSNYGVIIGSNVIDEKWFRLTNPTKKRPHVMELAIKHPIENKEYKVLYPEGRQLPIIYIPENENCQGVIRWNVGDYGYPIYCYFFSTKEGLEEYIREVTDIVEDNLKRINESLNNLI